VVLGILPIGGGNDFASALGLPSEPLEAAEAMHAVSHGTWIWLESAQPMAEHACTQVGRNWTRRGGRSARRWRVPPSTRPLPLHCSGTPRAGWICAFRRPGKDFRQAIIPSFEAKVLLAAVLNSPTYGAGVRLAPGAAVDDGLLHVVLIEEFSKFGVLTLLPRLMGAAIFALPRETLGGAQRVK